MKTHTHNYKINRTSPESTISLPDAEKRHPKIRQVLLEAGGYNISASKCDKWQLGRKKIQELHLSGKLITLME